MRKLACVLLISAMLLSLFGCEEQRPEGIPEETSAATTEVTTTVTPPEIEVTTTVPEAPEPVVDTTEYVEVSEGNVFVDFDYIKDCKGVTDRSKVRVAVDSAEKFLLESDNYKFATEHIEEYDSDELKPFLDKDGNIKPVFNRAIVEDFNSDGTEETFILMDMPTNLHDLPRIRCYLFYFDGGTLTLLNDYNYPIGEVSLLDYGKFKHLIVGSDWGAYGADGHVSIYGLERHRSYMPKLHYEIRGSYTKYKCFLSSGGWQASGDLMYFDTEAEEYRAIVGEELDLNEVLKMDTTDALKEYKEKPEDYRVSLIGNKYYCFRVWFGDSGTPFTYEDGKFIPAEEDGIRHSIVGDGMKAVKNIDMNKAENEMAKPEDFSVYTEVSEENVFVDFDYINDHKGITDRKEVEEFAEIAEKELYASEDYKYASENIERYSKDIQPYLDENGKIKPVFERAFVEDFDGDGKTEAFVVMNMPMNFSIDYVDGIPRIGCKVVFIDSSGESEILDGNFCPDNIFEMLDYGKYKQLVINSTESPSYSLIYGVKNGKPICHYGIRGGYTKVGCFLSSFGWQCSGDLMYFDTAENDYRIIVGEELDIEELFKLDKKGVLDKYKEYHPQWEGCSYGAYLIGKKYYCFKGKYWPDEGAVYLYENGEFVLKYDNESENFGIRYSEISEDKKLVKDIDMNKALAEMVKPSEYASKPEPEENPYIPETEIVEISEGNEFIDFEYIKNYRGITDREKVKDIAEVAEKAVAESGKVEECLDWVGGFEEEIRAYLKEHKDSKPKFLEAFIEDYDGDGNKEAFVMVGGVPGFKNYPGLIAILVFVDHNNNAQIVDEFFGYSNGYDGCASLLNYGKNKQLVIESCGTMGANEHTAIWGMKNGKPIELYNFRGNFEKHDCFLTGYGWGSQGDFMYFDTVALEYRPIVGIKLNADDVYAMDKTGSLDLDRKEFRDVQLIGGKYYHFILNSIDQWGTTYYYENGKFINANDRGIRRSGGLKAVVNIDIDKAITEMKKPTEVK